MNFNDSGECSVIFKMSPDTMKVLSDLGMSGCPLNVGSNPSNITRSHHVLLSSKSDFVFPSSLSSESKCPFNRSVGVSIQMPKGDDIDDDIKSSVIVDIPTVPSLSQKKFCPHKTLCSDEEEEEEWTNE